MRYLSNNRGQHQIASQIRAHILHEQRREVSDDRGSRRMSRKHEMLFCGDNGWKYPLLYLPRVRVSTLQQHNPLELRVEQASSRETEIMETLHPESAEMLRQVSVEPIYAASVSSKHSGPIKPWRKLLWLQQPYPDNYVDASFLSQLKRNSTVQRYSYWALAADFSLVVMHLCVIIVYISVFVGLFARGWNPRSVSLGCFGSTALGYVLWNRIDERNRVGTISIENVKSAVLIVFVVLALSPVLKSLTLSTSSDSIWALSVWLLLFNMLLHDYSLDEKHQFRPLLATNLAFASAIVLASRLATTGAVFSFVLFSIELFGLVPFFSKWLRNYSFKAHVICMFILTILVDLLVYAMTYSWALLGLWFFLQIFAVVIAPLWFIQLQQYKNEIQGPWDPARPVISSI